jgi:catechol 2,3-dioxygenase-like lactoylglutathione lyase family enzyme
MGTTRIRHIAICTKDPDGTAVFYEAAFGVKIVEKSETDEYRAIFCTDGSISIALLDFKTNEAAAKFNVDGGASFVGIHHMGFMVEDTDQALDYLRTMDVEPINQRARKPSESSHFEAKIRDPNGIVIDIARMWPGLEATQAT